MKRHILQIDGEDIFAEPTPYCREIECLARILDRDDSEGKVVARKELAYVYHMIDPMSPYMDGFTEEEREEQLPDDLFPDEDWEPDQAVQDAMTWYEEVNLTEKQRVLRSAIRSIQELRNHLDTVDLDERDENGKPIWKPKDHIRVLKDMGSVIDGLEDIEEAVEREQAEDGAIRGGAEVNAFSR